MVRGDEERLHEVEHSHTISDVTRSHSLTFSPLLPLSRPLFHLASMLVRSRYTVLLYFQVFANKRTVNEYTSPYNVILTSCGKLQILLSLSYAVSLRQFPLKHSLGIRALCRILYESDTMDLPIYQIRMPFGKQ